ncbi:hypothetical protein THRCLA_06440 [Thraustotheca clavata]|uniref:Aminotransferase class I/classII large domain-containing protein n=1 Tax=Thraustotheca clavata TaxID=74557 RepID=A0A1V9ZNR0_9STRA|nr:hypothetical protein THRCLA_06440 [Thraustotheca clavata]
MISLGGGMPNPSTFPFESMSVKLKSGKTMDINGAALESALQYSPTPGLPELVKTLTEMMEREHAPPTMARMLSITTGSQDALYKAFEMLVGEDDSLLVEKPTYSGTLAHLHAVNCDLVCIDTDNHGLVPESLASTLDNWPASKKKPKVLYTIPTGSNPTGASMPFERKKQVYAIAQKHGLIILEDDPYYYLKLDGVREKSFMHIDIDGRVLRFDSFSKILSSGLRVGTVMGPSPLIERLNLHTQSANLHSSGLSQAIVLALLQQWGQDGWNAHLTMVCDFYRRQRDEFLKALDKNLTGLATWNVPDAGMFVWINLHGVSDSKALIEQKAVEAKVLLVPGQVFLPDNQPTSYSFGVMKASAVVVALAAAAVSADVVLKYSSNGLVRGKEGVSGQADVLSLTRHAMEALAMPQTVVPVESLAVSVDMFKHVQAYGIVVVEGVNSNVGTTKGDYAFQKIMDVQEASTAQLPDLVSTLAEVVKGKNAKNTVVCTGNSVCNALDEKLTDEVVSTKAKSLEEDVWKQLSEFELTNEADKLVVSEIVNLKLVVETVKSSNSNAKGLFVASVSDLSGLAPEKLDAAKSAVASAVEDFQKELKNKYSNVGLQVLSLSQKLKLDLNELSEAVALSRRLSLSANATSPNASVTPLTIETIAEYQIILWSSVILAVIAILAVSVLCSMDASRDNLLYAKFLTDASHRKND